MYWSGDRDTMLARLARARDAGAKGIILTLDWSFANGRDWGSPWIPDKIGLKAVVKLAPEVRDATAVVLVLRQDRSHARSADAEHGQAGEKPPTFFGAYYEWMQSPLPDWDDVAWLRSNWEGPFMVKGVSRVDDAKRVVDLGATALSVSNHGGQQPRRDAGADPRAAGRRRRRR